MRDDPYLPRAESASESDAEIAKYFELTGGLELHRRAAIHRRKLAKKRIAEEATDAVRKKRLIEQRAIKREKRRNRRNKMCKHDKLAATAEREADIEDISAAYPEPPPTELVARTREDILAAIPANHTAKRQVMEGVFAGNVEDTHHARQRERKRIKQRDYRARKSTKPRSDWLIKTVKITLRKFNRRRGDLTSWLMETGKTQASLLREWKKALPTGAVESLAAGALALEITKDWFHFQKYVAEHGHQPGQTAFSKLLDVTTDEAKRRLHRLERMESRTGPWLSKR